MKRLQLTACTSPEGRTFSVSGRDAWALDELIRAGRRGCTPIDNPGPRWSAYIFNLKRVYGLAIETRHEPHTGSFPGMHARYVLMTQVEIVSRSDEKAMQAA